MEDNLGLMEDDLGLMEDNLLKLLITLGSFCTNPVLVFTLSIYSYILYALKDIERLINLVYVSL